MKISRELRSLILLVFLLEVSLAFSQKKVLVVLAHPNIEQSEVNKSFLSKLVMMEQLTVNNLYKNYPDFKIDIDKEQQLIEDHDVIIFQFPLYWFSSPALLRKWQDDVVTSKFAIGENNRMKGKKLMIVTSVGGTESDYQHGGSLNITMEEVLTPFKSFAHLTEMEYLVPFITYGVPNPKILNITMSTDQINQRLQNIESRGDELVILIRSLLDN